MSTKKSTSLQSRIDQRPRLSFWLQVLFFYLCIMTIILYFYFADVASGPEFIYNQF